MWQSQVYVSAGKPSSVKRPANLSGASRQSPTKQIRSAEQHERKRKSLTLYVNHPRTANSVENNVLKAKAVHANAPQMSAGRAISPSDRFQYELKQAAFPSGTGDIESRYLVSPRGRISPPTSFQPTAVRTALFQPGNCSHHDGILIRESLLSSQWCGNCLAASVREPDCAGSMDITEGITLRQLVPKKRMQKQLTGIAALAVGLAAAEVYNSSVTKSLRYLKRCDPSPPASCS